MAMLHCSMVAELTSYDDSQCLAHQSDLKATKCRFSVSNAYDTAL